nr:hypothetical protein [Caldilineaceae bacterium]
KDRRSVVFGWRSAVGILLLCVLAADLLLAARSLPHAHPTAPQAVYDIRTAPAHLLTDPQRGLHPGAMGRFLSMSTLTFDPGDMADWRRIYRQGDPPQLDEAAFQEFVVALKSQEILAPNLSLLQRVPAVDGFDGDVLPLERYNRFLALFIPPEELVPDGRLREQVKRIPAGALLELMDIRYVITDKVEDLWFDGVYYDRQIGARLGWDGVDEVIVPVDQPFQATEIRIIGSLVQGADALQSTPQVVELTASGGGQRFLFPPIAGGRGGALPQFGPNRMGEVRTDRGISGVAYQDTAGGRQEYLIRLGLPGLRNLESLRFSLTPETPPSVAVQIQAVTLYDGTTGTFLPLLPSDRGHFRLVHSGDVKIYERVGGPGRVSLLTDVTAVGNPDAALAALLAAP